MTLLDDHISHETSDEVAAAAPPPVPVNCVHLVGKLSKALQTKDLPSGDVLGSWNLVLARPKPVQTTDGAVDGDEAGTRRRQSHDTLECISFDRDLIERLRDVEQGAWLEVHGALRRRFRKVSEERQSSYNVEARTVDVLWTPAPAEANAAVDTAQFIDQAEPVTAAG